MNILKETPIALAAVKHHVDIIKKRDAEPNFRVTRLDDYLSAFSKHAAPYTLELAKKLAELNVPRLKDQHIHKLVELLPRTVDEAKLILQSYTITVSNDNVKKIVDAVTEAAPKK